MNHYENISYFELKILFFELLSNTDLWFSMKYDELKFIIFNAVIHIIFAWLDHTHTLFFQVDMNQHKWQNWHKIFSRIKINRCFMPMRWNIFKRILVKVRSFTYLKNWNVVEFYKKITDRCNDIIENHHQTLNVPLCSTEWYFVKPILLFIWFELLNQYFIW